MQVSQEMASLLGKIALSGLWTGHVRLSEEIFKSLASLRADKAGPVLGLAMCEAHRGHHAKGIEILEKQAFPQFESDPHVQAWYGFMLCMNKNSARGRAVLENLLASKDTPEDARKIAESTLSDL